MVNDSRKGVVDHLQRDEVTKLLQGTDFYIGWCDLGRQGARGALRPGRVDGSAHGGLRARLAGRAGAAAD